MPAVLPRLPRDLSSRSAEPSLVRQFERAHRYGHGTAEAIGAFVQAGFVLGPVPRERSGPPPGQSPGDRAERPRHRRAPARAPADRGAARVPALRGPPHRLDRDSGRQPALPQRPGLALIAALVLTRRPAGRASTRCSAWAWCWCSCTARRGPARARHAHGPGAAGRAARLHPQARPRAPGAKTCTTCAPGAPGPTCSSSWMTSSASSRRTT